MQNSRPTRNVHCADIVHPLTRYATDYYTTAAASCYHYFCIIIVININASLFFTYDINNRSTQRAQTSANAKIWNKSVPRFESGFLD